jgi:hypothetical protein
MRRFTSLSTGTKVMLVAGTLLFFDLFLTWQKLPTRYGRGFDVTTNLDAWDAWGLLLGLATLALLTLLILRETNVELSPDVPWSRITLWLTVGMLCVVVAKNLLDAYSAWASYAGVALAAACVVGAWLDRDRAQPERERPYTEQWKPRVRTPTRSADPSQAAGQSSEEPRAAKSSARW